MSKRVAQIHYIINKAILWLSNNYNFKGKYLIKRILIRVRPKRSKDFLVKVRKNFFLYINPIIDNGIEKKLFEKNSYESGTLFIMSQMIKEGDLVIDIGANIGLTTIHMSKLVKNQGEVFAFEPIKATRELLVKNISYNRCENIKVFSFGLSEKKMKAKIFHNLIINRGAASLINKGSEDSSFEKIQLICLDEIVNNSGIKRIDFIKVDIEGEEFKMLIGGVKSIRKFKPIICLEFSAENHSGINRCEMFEMLTNKLGYNVYKHSKNKECIGRLLPVRNSFGLPNHDNIYMLSREHLAEFKDLISK